ncbi:unnamed protein product [Rhizoctonia solani]|uniref:Uncharacterized protein n=1 Tax=Rhizoctonia solani TaxID=456999 RepID=A0A8H3HFV9_9AGAM|nr:unnamed protein product [Rhizoctonia solani]
MYCRASCYPLEVLAKSSVCSPVCFRSFSSASYIRPVATSHKAAGVRANQVDFTPETLEHKTLAHPKQGYTGPSHNPRIKPASHLPPNDRGPTREVHIATRVKGLCQVGKLKEAVEACVNTPAALQGAPAWNTVIHHALSEERYNYAYTLYQQMKKRHIIPTVATYTTFMSAYAQANPKFLTSTQLERVQNLYKDWANLVVSARTDNAIAAITWVHPAAAYISVLANAKLYQTIWDTFYDLDLESPLAPNHFVFTSMFVAFAKRTASPNDTINAVTSDDAASGDSPESTTSSLSDVKVKNAQDARLLWRQLVRSLERRPFPVDSHLVVAALRALQHGEKPELDLALSIVGQYLGLRAPDGPAPPEPTKPLELNVRLLDSALSVCNAAKRPDLTRHFLDIMTSPEHPQRSIVNTGAMNLLLEAYASLGDRRQIVRTIDWMIREGALPGGLEVLPGSSSWCIALRACLDAQDWDTAKTLTKRLASTTNSKRIIDAETIYLVLKITYVLKPTDRRLHERQLRQALDAVYYVVSVWPKDSNADHESYAKLNPGRVERRFVFQNALGDLVKTILNEFDGLGSIPGFHDLTYKLDHLRTNISHEIVARYKQDL